MTDPTTPRPTGRPDAGLREGHTGGVGNYSVMRSPDAAAAELAGGLADSGPPAPAGPDPFDLDLAYPAGAEMAGPLRVDRRAD